MKTSVDKKDFLKYLKSLGLKVNTGTMARGNKGFFCKNRIDISKKIEEERFLDTLAHEFAHYVHSKIEPSTFNKGGSLKMLFDCDDISSIEKELIEITNFIDPNSKLEKLLQIKEHIAFRRSII